MNPLAASARVWQTVDRIPGFQVLYDRLAAAVRRDLKEELEFVAVFDRAFDAVRAIVNMPDRRTSLLVRLCLQNDGRLAARKRRLFTELSDEEVSAMEAVVREAMAGD